MKNWIIVLLILIIPISLYSYLEAKAQSDAVCKVEGNTSIHNPKAKIIKFYSPMCSECKDVSNELTKAMKNYKDSVIIEEINVAENVNKSGDYTKAAIKKFKITLVPTLVFVDKNGNMIKKQEGEISSNEIIAILDGIK